VGLLRRSWPSHAAQKGFRVFALSDCIWSRSWKTLENRFRIFWPGRVARRGRGLIFAHKLSLESVCDCGRAGSGAVANFGALHSAHQELSTRSQLARHFRVGHGLPSDSFTLLRCMVELVDVRIRCATSMPPAAGKPALVQTKRPPGPAPDWG
jgi:hypothetical protein